MDNEFRYFIFEEEENHGCYGYHVIEFRTIKRAAKGLEHLLESGDHHNYNMGLQLYKVKQINLTNFSLKEFDNESNIHYFIDTIEGWFHFIEKQDALNTYEEINDCEEINDGDIIVYAGVPIKYSIKVQIES